MVDNVVEAKYRGVLNVKPHQAYCLIATDRHDTHVAFVVIANFELEMQKIVVVTFPHKNVAYLKH